MCAYTMMIEWWCPGVGFRLCLRFLCPLSVRTNTQSRCAEIALVASRLISLRLRSSFGPCSAHRPAGFQHLTSASLRGRPVSLPRPAWSLLAVFAWIFERTEKAKATTTQQEERSKDVRQSVISPIAARWCSQVWPAALLANGPAGGSVWYPPSNLIIC
jgi:hypothetical protein